MPQVAPVREFPHVPASEGIYNALDTLNPEGLVTNAQFPRPISGALSCGARAPTAADAVHISRRSPSSVTYVMNGSSDGMCSVKRQPA